MRLLHTSDWHLGRTLHGLDIIDVQRAAMSHIIDIAQREQVDAVLISGDVYDRAVPPVEAVQLFADTLRTLTRTCHVIVSSGNHDSAIRLGFGADLFTDRLHIRTRVDRIAEPVVLRDDDGDVLVYPIPYLDPDTVRRRLGEEPVERSHEAVMAAAMDLVRADMARREAEAGATLRTVVMAHAFVGHAADPAEAATRSESERDLRVGGVELVPSRVFAGITYTALGHLHGAQEPRLEGEGFLRYSGSPLRYSFSEAGHDKSVTIADLGMDGLKSISSVAVPQPRPMVELVGTMSELLDGSGAGHEGAWVKAVVTDATRPDRMYDLLKKRFPHLLSAHHRPADAPGGVRGVDPTTAKDPLEVVAAFVAQAGGADITDDELAAVREVYEALLRKEGADR